MADYYKSGIWTQTAKKLKLSVPATFASDPFAFWAEELKVLDATDCGLTASDWDHVESMAQHGAFASVKMLVLAGNNRLFEPVIVNRVASWCTGGKLQSLESVQIEAGYDAPRMRVGQTEGVAANWAPIVTTEELQEMMREKREADDANELLQLRSNGIREQMAKAEGGTLS